jgi:replicative DNA helicase
VQDHKDLVVKRLAGGDLGRLFIKEYPTNFATVMTLRSHIEKLTLKGFAPHVIIVDYADIMRSTHKFDSLRYELKLIYEELRGLGMELNLPIWTASQSNRDGASSDIVDLTNMSEAYGKAMVADFVVTLSRKSKEKSSGFGRLYVAKNRAGRDGIVFPMRMDTSMSTLEILDDADEMTVQDAQRDDDRDMRKVLKEKLREINGSQS